MHDYSAHVWGQRHFDYRPEGSPAIDQYVAKTEMSCNGQSAGVVRQRMAMLFSRRVSIATTDPQPKTIRQSQSI